MGTRTPMLLLGACSLLVPGAAWAAEGAEVVGAVTLVAPLVAIALALITKKVIPSLAVGVVLGAVVASGFVFRDAAWLLVGFVADAVLNMDHFAIALFSVLVAAMVGLVSRAGGTRAMVELLLRTARGPRGAQLASWLGGIAVFFDDYANCLVVGHAMGPLFDRHRVSRAKLAFLVDATAAPVASLALISTWVGYELGFIESALGITGGEALGIFLRSLPYRFFSLLMLIFALVIALSGRDFGAMLRSENAPEAPREPSGEAEALPGASAWLAILPILTLVGVSFAWLVVDGAAHMGQDTTLLGLLGEADPYRAILGGSLVSLVVAILLLVGTRSVRPGRLGSWAWAGVRPVLGALGVLYLAWALGDAVGACHTAEYLSGALDGRLPAWTLPGVAFAVAAGTSFATGSSFGTMGLVLPLALPMAAALPDQGAEVVPLTTAAVLCGAVIGDQGSPISDTTLLSALGSGTEMLVHFRTQLPYVLVVGGVALAMGFLPAGLGISPLLLLLAGAALLTGLVLLLGRPPAPVPVTPELTPAPLPSVPPSTQRSQPRISRPSLTSLSPGLLQSIEDLVDVEARPHLGEEE